MAEILITGIEMPKEGECLYLAITSGGVVGRSEKALNYIPQNAKARDLPPHGELLNRDNILFLLQAEALGIDPKDKDFEGIKKGLLLARKAVNKAVSVIPASRE